MTAPKVVVLDYGSGNIHSAIKALELAGACVQLSADRNAVAEADGLFVPGVGAFAAVMTALRAVDGPELIERRLAGGRPVLGVCVGMQIMFDEGVEGGSSTAGLAQWPGVVSKLDAPVVPHMGWSTVDAASGSVLFDGVEHDRFYFVHSFAAKTWSLESAAPFHTPKVTWAEHGTKFIAAVENGPLTATQFHPEKSGAAGIRVLSNWIASL